MCLADPNRFFMSKISINDDSLVIITSCKVDFRNNEFRGQCCLCLCSYDPRLQLDTPLLGPEIQTIYFIYSELLDQEST